MVKKIKNRKNITKIILNSKILNYFGISLINLDYLFYITHYKWVLKIFKIPYFKINFLQSDINQIDKKIISRIKKSYSISMSSKQEKNISGLWDYSLDYYSHEIHDSILNKDNTLQLFNNMFNSKFIFGLASGDIVKHSDSFLGKKIWNLKYIDSIISLASYLGCTRYESPQQGDYAQYSKIDIENIIDSIENKIKNNISFPNIGSPYGVIIKKTLLTQEDLEHLYAALRIKEYLTHLGLLKESNNKFNFLEIGGGYGGLCRWLNILLEKNINTYTIVDLPLISQIQAFFLSNFFKKDNIVLPNEKNHINSKIILKTNLEYLNDTENNYNIVINQNSMPEMTDEIVEEYLNKISNNNLTYFISFNHEAISVHFNQKQVSVREICEKNPKLKLILRNPSFMRNGYLEEIYNLKKS
jgi:putative sugar O-methyltransferase